MCWGCPGTFNIRDAEDPRLHVRKGCTCKWVLVPASDFLHFSYWAVDHDGSSCDVCRCTITVKLL